MEGQIRVDTRQIERYLQKMPRQIPFAISTALNETAKEVRTGIVRRVWPRSVDARARGFAGRAFRLVFAKKNRLVSAVYADPTRVSGKGIAAIKQLEEGLRHFPFRSRYLAVPTYNALTPTGRLKKVAKAALDENSRDAFVADLRGRGPAIWQRTPKGLRLLFVLKPSVPTPKAFPFTRSADRIARDRWQGNIRRSVIRAVKTAR